MSAVNIVAAPERFNASVLLDRNLDAGRGAKPAVLTADRSLTYAELLGDACRAGHLLRALGVAREERVLLVLDDTSAFPRVFLGAVRLGAVPVPVSPLDRADNFRHFVDDSYARVVVADAGCVPMLRDALDGRDLTFVSAGGAAEGALDLLRRPAARAGHGGRVRVRAHVRVGGRGAVTGRVRPLARAPRPRDRRRDRLDRDAAHLLLERPRRGRARQHRAAGAGLRAAHRRRGRDRARGRGGGQPRGPRRQLRGVLLAPAREDEGVDAGGLVHHGRPHRRTAAPPTASTSTRGEPTTCSRSAGCGCRRSTWRTR